MAVPDTLGIHVLPLPTGELHTIVHLTGSGFDALCEAIRAAGVLDRATGRLADEDLVRELKEGRHLPRMQRGVQTEQLFSELGVPGPILSAVAADAADTVPWGPPVAWCPRAPEPGPVSAPPVQGQLELETTYRAMVRHLNGAGPTIADYCAALGSLWAASTVSALARAMVGHWGVQGRGAAVLGRVPTERVEALLFGVIAVARHEQVQ